VPVGQPILPRMLRGDFATVRLSDLVSRRKLHPTPLFNDVFKPLAAGYQVVIPFISGQYICGLTANRGGKDFSDEELEMAKVFSRHLVAAYSTEQVLLEAQASRAHSAVHAALRRRGLTRRESEVLWWAAEGKGNAEIGVILGIATVTVEVHLTAAYRKLGVENRMAAVRVLLANG
jgi:DNA-binding CsgD family transcriptional regulator